jgi:hypothetical protein
MADDDAIKNQASDGQGQGPTAEVVDLETARKAAAAQRKKRQGELDRLVTRFNQKYAVVNDGGELRVFWERPDPLRLGHWTCDRFSFADFGRAHLNRRLTLEAPDPKNPAKTKAVTKSVATWWLEHPTRREYLAGVVFDPKRSLSADHWNLWKGYAVQPRRGSWRLMQEHLFDVVCAGSQEHYRFLLDTTARMLRHPESPAEVCVVLKGEEGAGKGVFLSALYKILGQHGLHISHPEHLRGKHNAHLRDCVYLFADEAFYAGDKQHESILKALITEDSLAIEPKNKNIFEAPNYLHIYMSSNLAWVVPAALRARRWFVLGVSDQRVGDSKYFTALHHEIEHGGLAAMLFDLLRRDLGQFDPRRVPATAELAEQKLHSLDTLHRWWMAALDRGFVWRSRYGVKAFAEWPEFCTTELLWRSYLQFCDDARLFQRQTRVELGKLMATLYTRHRPGRPYPVFEVEALPMIGQQRGAGSASDEPMLPLGALPGAVVVEDVDPLEKLAVVQKPDQPGYQLGTLEEARARFAEITGDLPMPW